MMPTDSRLVRLFLGIFCRPNQYAHRALIRATMLSFAPSAPGAFDHRFVVCGAAHSTRADERRGAAREGSGEWLET